MMNKIVINFIEDQDMKSNYTNYILRTLPDWFGIESSIVEYVDGVKKFPFFCALNELNECVGFICGKIHYNITGDIYVCGVKPDYHKNGIGKLLFKKLEKYFIDNNCKKIIVKTLSDIINYEPYEKTRMFYKKIGFNELVTLTEMWDSSNPCLIMIKDL